MPKQTDTAAPLYNMLRYNTVLDITLITGHFRLFLQYVYTFYSRYNTDWIANM